MDEALRVLGGCTFLAQLCARPSLVVARGDLLASSIPNVIIFTLDWTEMGMPTLELCLTLPTHKKEIVLWS